MAELTTLARPYAKAAFERARETEALLLWSNALALLAALTKEQVVVTLLNSPTLTAQQKAAALINLGGDQLNDEISRFIIVLAENRRLLLLLHIQSLFENFKAQQEKYLDVEVLTVFDLDENIKKELAEKLSTNLGSHVSLTVSIDKTLLGGALIRAGDMVIDGSVRGRLTKLAEAMN